MAPPPGNEKRRSARIRFKASDNLEVRYKFLSHLEDYKSDAVFNGLVFNLSKGGALFQGAVPGLDWLPRLGEGRILIGMNIMVPVDGLKAVKALASLRWCRPSPDAPGRPDGKPVYEMGVQFEQLDPEHRSNLAKFLIGVQIRTRKFNRRELLENDLGGPDG
jgi:c-di-GMP-binding flagellar brake protein YcgR